jgi:hypothetical protein
MIIAAALQSWTDLGPLLQYGPTIILLLLVLGFLLKSMPAWKEVKLKELELRNHEIAVRGEEAKSLSALSEVLRDVAVEQRKATDEQRRATETIDILQRVNSDASDRLASNVAVLNDRLDRIERLSQLSTQHESLSNRVGALEAHSNVQSGTTTAGA